MAGTRLWFRTWAAVTAAMVLAAVAVIASGFGDDTPDRALATTVTSAAEEAVAGLLTYDYRTIKKDQDRAKTRLTSYFARRYDFRAVRRYSRDLRAVQTVEIRRSRVAGPIEDGRAEVLVELDTITRSKFEPERHTVVFRLGMAERNGRWLLDALAVARSED